MLSNYGHRALLAGLVKPYGLRVKVDSSVYGVVFPCDPGYPKFDDQDPANVGRGGNVLTWAFTIPHGTDWGPGLASGGEMVERDEVVYTTKLEPFRPSRIHPCKVYINIILRKL